MMTTTLWDFATTRYAQPGVAACCLRLQDDAGADVNLLLAAAWLAGRGCCWRDGEVRELIARCTDWRECCVQPLRAVRRYLKERDEDRALYARAKALELDAELRQLHLLHDALISMAPATAPAAGTDALTANLETYFDCIAPSPRPDAAVRALIEALGRRPGNPDGTG